MRKKDSPNTSRMTISFSPGLTHWELELDDGLVINPISRIGPKEFEQWSYLVSKMEELSKVMRRSLNLVSLRMWLASASGMKSSSPDETSTWNRRGVYGERM